MWDDEIRPFTELHGTKTLQSLFSKVCRIIHSSILLKRFTRQNIAKNKQYPLFSVVYGTLNCHIISFPFFPLMFRRFIYIFSSYTLLHQSLIMGRTLLKYTIALHHNNQRRSKTFEATWVRTCEGGPLYVLSMSIGAPGWERKRPPPLAMPLSQSWHLCFLHIEFLWSTITGVTSFRRSAYNTVVAYSCYSWNVLAHLLYIHTNKRIDR